MRRERTFATAERVAAAVAARLACLHEDGAALALSGDWTHSAAILPLVRAHLASLTKGAANDPTDGEVAKAFTRAKAAAKKRRRDQENATGPALVPIVEAAKLLAGR